MREALRFRANAENGAADVPRARATSAIAAVGRARAGASGDSLFSEHEELKERGREMFIEWWAVLVLFGIFFAMALVSMGGNVLDAIALCAVPFGIFAVTSGFALLVQWIVRNLLR
jgi:hypothetical protein